MNPDTFATFLQNSVTANAATSPPYLDLDESWNTGVRAQLGFVITKLDAAVRELFPEARVGWVKHTRNRYRVCVDDGASSWTSEININDGVLIFEDGKSVWAGAADIPRRILRILSRMIADRLI